MTLLDNKTCQTYLLLGKKSMFMPGLKPSTHRSAIRSRRPVLPLFRRTGL